MTLQLKELLPHQLTFDIWEEHANDVLSQFNFASHDEIDLFEICTRYGIKIKSIDKSNYAIKSFAIPKKKGRTGTIYIYPGLNAIEERILLAEEFCHCYLHNMNQLQCNKQSRNKTESQAKKMSAYLLIPSSFLENIDVPDDENVWNIEIANHFMVSEEFANYRLKLIRQRTRFPHQYVAYA